MISLTYDRYADWAYLSLTPKAREGDGAKTTIELGALAASKDLPALGSLSLDFDADGRLIGIEFGEADETLPHDLIAERAEDQPHRRTLDEPLPRPKPPRRKQSP